MSKQPIGPSPIRAGVRRLLPASLRRSRSLWLRQWRDWQRGTIFATTGQHPGGGTRIVSLAQPLLPTPGSRAKCHNLQLAIQRIEPLLLTPGATFSFWRMVGEPGPGQGFLKGRHIEGGILGEGYGGGLCQLAGLLYHLCLSGKLTIVERHPHSLDIYREGERYTPLGADATVVYGYKDLRVRNDGDAPVWFSLKLVSESLQASLYSTKQYLPARVRFDRLVDEPSFARVQTWRDGQLINISDYQRRSREELITHTQENHASDRIAQQ